MSEIMRPEGSNIRDETITGADVQDHSLTPDDLNMSSLSGFMAQRGSTQSLSANTWTKIQYATEVYDRQTEYDVATYRFTAKQAGLYAVFASAGWSSGSTLGTNVQLVLYKNGAQHLTLDRFYTTQTANDVSSGAALVNLAAGDYIEIYANASRARTVNGNVNECYFSMVKVE